MQALETWHESLKRLQFIKWTKKQNNLWDKYQTELTYLAYRPIPSQKDVADCIRELLKRIEWNWQKQV